MFFFTHMFVRLFLSVINIGSIREDKSHYGNISVQKGPRISTLHIVKRGKLGIGLKIIRNIFSIFLHKIICCGCVLESPQRDDSNTHPQHMSLWRTSGNSGKNSSIILSFCGNVYMSAKTFT